MLIWVLLTFVWACVLSGIACGLWLDAKRVRRLHALQDGINAALRERIQLNESACADLNRGLAKIIDQHTEILVELNTRLKVLEGKRWLDHDGNVRRASE